MNVATRRGFAIAATLLVAVAFGVPNKDTIYTVFYKFSVTPPTGWSRGPAGSGQGLVVSYNSPSNDGSKVANLNVVVRALPDADTLDIVLRRTAAQLAREVPGIRKVSSSPGTLDGQPAVTSVYTIPKQGFTLFSIQTLSVVGKGIYALTGTTDQVNAKAFGLINAAFVKSFHFKK